MRAPIAAATNRMNVASTTIKRRRVARIRGAGSIPATRSRSDDGASPEILRSSRARPCRRASSWVSAMAPPRSASRRAGATSSGDDMGFHPLFELLQGSRKPHRARGAADSEHARRGDRVQLEHDAQDDDLALPGAQRAQSSLELWRDSLGERLRGLRRFCGRAVFPLPPPCLRAEVVERFRAGELAEPRALGAAARIEALP